MNIVTRLYVNALIYSPECIKSKSSIDKALNVLKPPQKPVIKNILYIDSTLLFETKYTKTTVAIKQPKKFAINVLSGKYVIFGVNRVIIYLTTAPKPPPTKTSKKFIFTLLFIWLYYN